MNLLARLLISCLAMLTVMTGCASNGDSTPELLNRDGYVVSRNYAGLEDRLRSFVADNQAHTGIAVIINGKDTVSVNGNREFPMMSVFKFPLALTVAQWMDAHGMSPGDSISIVEENLLEDTYSPMLKKYGKGLKGLPVRELLEWSLVESDNNAADVLLKLIGGPAAAMGLLKEVTKPGNISIGASEANMHRDQRLSRLNSSTPLAMAALFDNFDSVLKYRSRSLAEIAAMIERCNTGIDRLAAPLKSYNATIGHKTGTGFDTPAGGISALNDCGYIHLPDGTRYSIAVFIADSPYDIDHTAKIIADISAMVLEELTENKLM